MLQTGLGYDLRKEETIPDQRCQYSVSAARRENEKIKAEFKRSSGIIEGPPTCDRKSLVTPSNVRCFAALMVTLTIPPYRVPHQLQSRHRCTQLQPDGGRTAQVSASMGSVIFADPEAAKMYD